MAMLISAVFPVINQQLPCIKEKNITNDVYMIISIANMIMIC